MNINQLIKNLTIGIRNQFGIDPNAPFTYNQLEELVKKLNGRIENVDYLNYDAEIIKKTGDIDFEIILSEYPSVQRKMFSIAHELGHLFLHMLYLINDDHWNSLSENQSYRREGLNKLESEANSFAAELLMPEEEYLNQLKKNKVLIGDYTYFNTQAMARYFNVSENAIINRGKWLGVFAW
ncbi:MAG: ImmA/IrrE family metallo-endopeptidase [Cetobacterium sp.]